MAATECSREEKEVKSQRDPNRPRRPTECSREEKEVKSQLDHVNGNKLDKCSREEKEVKSQPFRSCAPESSQCSREEKEVKSQLARGPSGRIEQCSREEKEVKSQPDASGPRVCPECSREEKEVTQEIHVSRKPGAVHFQKTHVPLLHLQRRLSTKSCHDYYGNYPSRPLIIWQRHDNYCFRLMCVMTDFERPRDFPPKRQRYFYSFMSNCYIFIIYTRPWSFCSTSHMDFFNRIVCSPIKLTKKIHHHRNCSDIFDIGLPGATRVSK